MSIELVVGLGNPGEGYEASRHNLGFRVVDLVARQLEAAAWEVRGPSLLSRAGRDPQVWLAQPQTYMNRSGTAVLALATELELEAGSILVVADDVDLPLGRLRLRSSGGPGTHNGLRDVVVAIGEGFPRLRVGVRGERPFGDLAEYVLAPFAPDEEGGAAEAVERAADAVLVALVEGLPAAMNRFNRAAAAPEEELPAADGGGP